LNSRFLNPQAARSTKESEDCGSAVAGVARKSAEARHPIAAELEAAAWQTARDHAALRRRLIALLVHLG